jgi:pyruvate,water dikinase
MAPLARFTELPRVIDSRGRIIRPPTPPARPGELVGHPVSAGVARGAVKVLHSPDEKPLLPGEILVARATDPGWTPLFVNAAAVVLEVGGVLQHGALVAREYGKACVVGVDAATRRLKDGMIVEVDGAAGVVRLQAERATDVPSHAEVAE